MSQREGTSGGSEGGRAPWSQRKTRGDSPRTGQSRTHAAGREGNASQSRVRRGTQPLIDATAVLTAIRQPEFSTAYLSEPQLIFGDNLRQPDPKTGLALHGPYDLREPGRRGVIRLGIIGTGPMIDATLAWIERCKGRVLPIRRKKEKGKLREKPMDATAYPPFPGLAAVFASEFIIGDGMTETVGPREMAELKQIELFEPRITRLIDLIVERLGVLADRMHDPDVVICALPTDVRELCTIPARHKTRAKQPRTLADELRASLVADREAGQGALFDIAAAHNVSVEETGSAGEQSVFRHGLKARAMVHGIPVQLVWQETLEGTATVEDDATRAWNLWTGIYYKARGIPWRVAGLERGTCYVGVAFYRDKRDGSLRTCMAQAFSDQGEGLVLRSEPFKWDATRTSRSPHLPRELAEDLMRRVIEAYSAVLRQAPSRIVVHKWQRYSQEEREGFRASIEAAGVHSYDLVAFGDRGIRFFRAGQEPPLRGTMITIAPGDVLLYTRGYVPFIGEYSGMRVPRPIEIVEHHGASALTKVCQEILALTKMDWNSAVFAGKAPITTAFSEDVGQILAELPPSITPRTQYRFYM